MLVRKSIGLSLTSVWQRECQTSTRLFILNFRVVDLMIKPSVRMMMNEVYCILCIIYML
ncbi:hypothetical protein ES288_D03G110900v1 [Gossypium darwinii]|uniref:Uncharacterized protein n=1 Tax=Gossypium darwinii TaxID=34276 RepID=A0A5D2D7T9_GOSDA|nr:hypothetical protein ES288_D03G110900v1 [Gossypium darwinii]